MTSIQTETQKAFVTSIVKSVKDGVYGRNIADPIIRQNNGDPDALFAVQEVSVSVAVAAPVVEEAGPFDSEEIDTAVEASPTILHPDERGEFKSPSDGAKWMAAIYKIPQIPLRGKAPFMESWPDKATLDLDQIDRWSLEFPGCNFGSVSKAVLGGRFVLEVDSPDVAKRAAKDGVTFTSELIIESRPGRGHRWYAQSEESISLGNIKQDASAAGDFSVRVHNEQCVSPGSVNPVSGKQYRVKLSKTLNAASAAEIKWLNAQRIDKAAPSIKTATTNQEVKVPHGQIHPWMLTQSGRLRNNGLTPDEIEPILLRLVFLHCQEPINESKVRAMAKSMAAYKEGNPAAEYVYTETCAEAVETTTANVVEESLPDFPVLTGLLAELSEAVCPDIPREFKLMSAVTIWGLLRAGRDTLRNEHLQPRFYTFFVKEPGWGKSAAINEMRKYMSMLEAMSPVSSPPSIDSGPALVDELKELMDKASFRRKTPPDPYYPEFGKCLLSPDELTDLFEKAKQTANSKNTLSQELLRLYENTETSNRARGNNKGKKTHVKDVHLALIGGATPFGYESMWTSTGGGATGLQSRAVVITTNAPKMSIKKTPTDIERAVKVLGRLGKAASQGVREFVLTPQAEELLYSWWQSKPRALDLHDSRAEDMVKRMLIVLAGSRDGHDDICGPDMTDYDLTIDCDLVALACQFGDYVIACREKFNVADSHSWIQSAELAIMKVARKHDQPLSQKDLRRLTNADRKPGGLSPFTQAMRNLIGEGMLVSEGKNRVGNPLYRPEKS